MTKCTQICQQHSSNRNTQQVGTIHLENGEFQRGIVRYFVEAQVFESIASFKNHLARFKSDTLQGRYPTAHKSDDTHATPNCEENDLCDDSAIWWNTVKIVDQGCSFRCTHDLIVISKISGHVHEGLTKWLNVSHSHLLVEQSPQIHYPKTFCPTGTHKDSGHQPKSQLQCFVYVRNHFQSLQNWSSNFVRITAHIIPSMSRWISRRSIGWWKQENSGWS